MEVIAAILGNLAENGEMSYTKAQCFRLWKEGKVLSDLMHTKDGRSQNIFSFDPQSAQRQSRSQQRREALDQSASHSADPEHGRLSISAARKQLSALSRQLSA